MADEKKLSAFLNVIEQVKQEDSKWTSAQQIERLLRPGAKYRNLNPYEVLQVNREDEDNVIKKAFRKLSFLVHPDKNPDRVDEAKQAFDVVNSAYQKLQDEDEMAWVDLVYAQAEEEFPYELEKKRKEAKKKKEQIPEDASEDQRKESFKRFLMKKFADLEVEKNKMMSREYKKAQKERQEEEEKQAKMKAEREAQKQWEEGREDRVTSWMRFADVKKKKKKAKTLTGGVRVPKLKQEQRS
eukprot:m.230029 g.230029  ORF g.230029 m.230029 type:complete len:241 (-) comp17057_c1_seq1:59-781(-)